MHIRNQEPLGIEKPDELERYRPSLCHEPEDEASDSTKSTRRVDDELVEVHLVVLASSQGHREFCQHEGLLEHCDEVDEILH